MRLKGGRLLLLLCLLCIHHAAAQAQAGSSGIVDTIADSSQDFGDALSDAVSTAGKTVKSAASKAGGTVANATSTAAESIANKTTAAVAASANAAEALEGEELDAAVRENADAQAYKEDPSFKVVAQVVDQEPAAELANGDADLSTTGVCEDDIDQYCLDVMPGLGRLAICLSDQIKEQGKEGYSGTNLSQTCSQELDKFRRDQSANINLDLPLAQACSDDVQTLCSHLAEGESSLSCLREHRDQVSGDCSSEIFRRQENAADDFRLDKELYTACQADAQSLCRDIDPHGGKVQECLTSNRFSLSYDCQAELFRQEQEDSEDLRLSIRLFHKCLNDKIQFCGDVAPGNARAKECLEQHREEANFSRGCKEELETMIQARSADFRLDSQLKRQCTKDIENLCMPQKYEVADLPDDHATVIACLQDYREEIENPSCKARVTKVKELAASDIRFDIPLAEACYDDRRQFCSGVPPGSARVIRCLQDSRQDLSAQCSAQLFDEEVDMAESIDFQIPMKTACRREISSFCKDVPHGHARVIRCLQDNLKADNFTQSCKAEVQRYEQTASTDYRLNYRLTQACGEVLKEMCINVCPDEENMDKACGGTVLRCLADKIDDINDDTCKQELLYFQKMEVRDFRNDVILAEACRQDVDHFCASVKPGDGKVHQCLVDHQDSLTVACRAETNHLSIAAASNVELSPSLGKACASERQAHCKGVTPGKARVFNCLLANADKMNMTASCNSNLKATQGNRLRNWRLDYGVRKQCKADVSKYCGAADNNSEDEGSGAVLKCLVAANQSLTTSCLSEVQRALASALMLYQPGLPVTSDCDADIMAQCMKTQGLDTFAVGQVKACLVNLGVPQDPSVLLAAEAEAAEAAPTASNRPGVAAADALSSATNAEAIAADKSATTTTTTGRKLLDSYLSAAAIHEVHRRKLLQQAKNDVLSPRCKSLVLLAEPSDAFAQYQTSLSASVASSQVEALESKLGLRPGTLSSRNTGGLTLTGWTAVLGIVAIVMVAAAGGVFAYRQYKGLDKHAGYTMVKKSKARQVELSDN